MSLEIPQETYERMVEHARAGLPNEACGVLAGVDGKVTRLYPMRNAEESPVVYRFDEVEQLAVFREVEDAGLSLLAFFHSHTHTEAYPSPTDIRQAHWEDPEGGPPIPAYPETRYLVLSLRDDPPVLRGFTFSGGDPVEEEVRIV